MQIFFLKLPHREISHNFFENDTFNLRVLSVVDRTEPNLPNTEASVRYYSVWFGEIQKYRTESLLLILSIFKGFRDLLNHFLREK